jgi:hypothetical protein
LNLQTGLPQNQLQKWAPRHRRPLGMNLSNKIRLLLIQSSL